MVYVKPTVHLSRLAGAALKSFSHGYAQTVVAASQSSYAAQNTSATPLADTLLGRWRKAEKHKFKDAFQVESSRQASTSARPESSHNDAGLEKYLDAWQKNQRNDAKEWQQYQFARRIEWQPPTATQDESTISALRVEEVTDDDARPPLLRRSYTTSALNDFGKLFENDELAEAEALAQVNDAIAGEVSKAREVEQDASSSVPSVSDSISPQSSFTSVTSSADSAAQSWAEDLIALEKNSRYAEIPASFRSMLQSGVTKPTPAAYHALLTSVLELTHGQYQNVSKALEVYSDMLHRGVTPDSATFSRLITLLATRALEAAESLRLSNERLARYGGMEQAGKFIFRSSELEHTMLAEDTSLLIAIRLFSRAAILPGVVLSSDACAVILEACARCGLIRELNEIYKYGKALPDAMPPTFMPTVIETFGTVGDLKSAVEVYDQYKDMAIAHNKGELHFDRIDTAVYASLIKAYGLSDRLKGGLKFLAGVQAQMHDETMINSLRSVVALQALLPLTLRGSTYANAFDLAISLDEQTRIAAIARICEHAADHDQLEASTNAFQQIPQGSQAHVQTSMAMLAMHIRNGDVEAGEPYWRVIESAPATTAFIEPAVMRTVALIANGQPERGLRQARRIFSRIRDVQPESRLSEASEQIAEAIEVTGNFVLRNNLAVPPEASAELLHAMVDNGGLVNSIADHLLARLGPEHISRLSAADLELVLRIQAGLIVNETSADIAGPARFACLLENIIAKSVMPSSQTETIIERTLVNLDKAELSRLWNQYRYPPSPVFTTNGFVNSPVAHPVYAPRATTEDSFDPYINRTDVKGSNVINEMLERGQGRRTSEALVKFRNMRRIGRVPRMFTYGKLIEAAARDNNLSLAHEILGLAKQDVPFDPQFRVVRFGWQQILDHMIAGCLSMGRRDLASKYHQDLTEMGAAPSANTFGLYITTLKANTKTFDEASEAVKIFHQAKTEGVEPTSFLYNALIGKLGKARRIDDCLFYFAEMRNLGIRPTSVTYGTIVNALCRVSDDKFAEEIFEEMEACANYKPRPAPYHSLMQFFLTTKRDRSKVLAYYERMRSKNIEPTVHTFKLLIDAHATLDPVNMTAAQAVLEAMKTSGIQPEAVHYAALIHAQGCVMHDLVGARKIFDDVLASGSVRIQPCVYQAMFESLNANHKAGDSTALLADLDTRRIDYTPYIANALIHGWTMEKDIDKARSAFDRVRLDNREPSTYEAMVRAYLAVEQRDMAKNVVREALRRGYPSAVAGKIAELVH